MANVYENLLAVAEELLDVESFGSAGRRRAISTAYYAAFRRMASLCAAMLAGSSRDDRDAYEIVLRSLNHKDVLKALSSKEAKLLFRTEVGTLFGALLKAREWADYSSASHVSVDKAKNNIRLTRAEAAKFVSGAREIVSAIDALDESARRKLSIILAFHKR